jgi:hypothetical protein
MRTQAMRTQGTENPDAFIRLNIKYNYENSKSSSLTFYNPCVERQLCVVDRGYAIVTKHQ